MMISLITTASIVVGGLLVVCCLRTFRKSLRSKSVRRLNRPTLIGSALETAEQKSDDAVTRFSKALQFRTVSTSPRIYDRFELKKFVDFLKESEICV